MAQKTILVVEDDELVADYLYTALNERGFAVLGPVARGEDVIDRVRVQKLDLILMDINLAGEIDGITAAENIRSFSDVPVIYLTGHFHAPLLEQAKITAPYGYLVKPVSRQELVATIEMALYRHALDMKLKASEERLKLALASSHTGVWEWSAARDDIFWSPESDEFVGARDFGKTFESFTNVFHADDAARMTAAIRQLSTDRPMFSEECRIVSPMGTIRWFANIGRGYFDAAGTLASIIGTTQDVTERKEAEELREKVNEKLEKEVARRTAELLEANETLQNEIIGRRRAEQEAFKAHRELLRMDRLARLGELSASLSHELNQPLTAILANASAALRFLQSGRVDPGELADILQDIVNDDKRAGDIVRSLRAMVKPDEGRQESISINDVLHQTVGLFESEAIIRNMRIEMDLADPLPPLMGNKVQIQQVLINLMMNAAESMTQDGRSERIMILQTSAPHHAAVQVAVHDFGPGIEEQELPRIFEPFFTTKKSGLGMGLSLSRSIIESHGGHIWAENNPDKGATFYFDLPVMDSK